MEKLSCADKEWGNVPIAFGQIVHASLLWPEKWREKYSQLDGNEKVVQDEVLGGYLQHNMDLPVVMCKLKRLGSG